jgi:hypothetical protein
LQHFVGNVLDSEWKDLQGYTRSLSSALICTDEGPKIPEATCFRLGQLQGATKTLFPSLQRLNFTNKIPGSSPFQLPFLFSPALREVVIVNVGTTFALTVSAFLYRLGEEATLEHLTLDSLHLTSHLMRGIGNCRQLKTLNLDKLKVSLDGLDVLEMLGVLSELHDLRITVEDDLDYPQACSFESPPSSNPPLDSLKLPPLKNLQLVGGRPMVQDILYLALCSQTLETLFIHLTGYYLPVPRRRKLGKKLAKKYTQNPELDRNQDLVETIAYGLATTLKSFTLKIDATSPPNIGLPHNTIINLVELKNLENLDLSGILLPIERLDSTFSTLGGFWPKVQHLCLPLVSENHLSLSTLALIANSCRSLISLECGINLHKSFSAPADGMVSHRLKRLVIRSPGFPGFPQLPLQQSDTRLARSIANFLYALFPDIMSIIEIHQSQFWEEVSESVQMCQQAREYDRKREMQRQDGK